jgi:hypothetical protein
MHIRDIFFRQQTASVVCSQRVSKCIRSARRIVIFCENDGTTRAAVLHQILPEAWR